MMDEYEAAARFARVYNAISALVESVREERSDNQRAEVERLERSRADLKKRNAALIANCDSAWRRKAGSYWVGLDRLAQKYRVLEAEVERLRKERGDYLEIGKTLAAERDRYKRVVDAIRDDVNGDDCLFNKDRALTMEGLL